LVRKLLDDGYTVMLETNGSLDIGKIDGRCIKIIDVKMSFKRRTGKKSF